MADEVRLIDANSLLKGIEELKESPWFKRGKLEETDTNVDYNRSLFHIGYLERKEAIEIIIDLCIKKEPTIKVIPVKHGRWLHPFRCSECGFEPYYASDLTYSFCPNCGVRMEDDKE